VACGIEECFVLTDVHVFHHCSAMLGKRLCLVLCLLTFPSNPAQLLLLLHILSALWGYWICKYSNTCSQMLLACEDTGCIHSGTRTIVGTLPQWEMPSVLRIC
jgi:hypothetical protein